MTKWERLKKFEIPLAMPVIVSGGSYSNRYDHWDSDFSRSCWSWRIGILYPLGIDRRNASLILIGAISSAILAILFNVILKWLEKAKLRTIVAAFAVMLLGLGASYAPSMIPQKEKKI